jgi:nucleotide-binding universal stress UspA family protein
MMAGIGQDEGESVVYPKPQNKTSETQQTSERNTQMALTAIVSYDGTANENDALALGSLLARAGAEVHIGYVRHSEELVDDQEANELLERGRRLFDGPLAGAHTVTDVSTPAGLRSLAQRIGAQAIVFCSDSHTAPGHVTIGNSAEHLLDGGPVAVAIAPVGLYAGDGAPIEIERIVAVGEAGGDGSAERTARAFAQALGAKVVPVADEQADLLVIDSRPEAPRGQVSLSSSAEHLIEIATCPVLALPSGVELSLGRGGGSGAPDPGPVAPVGSAA